jgi:hypothetical protein
MADKRITELNLHTSLELGDVLPIVNSSETKKSALGSVNTFIRSQNTPLTASGLTVGDGNIVPTTPQGATLGTIDKPFSDIFIQSGSISIESDIPGDPSAIISNNDGNLEISIGGMLLVESDASFIAPTGSFDKMTADLTENYVWLGDSNNRNTPVSLDTLAQSGSYIQKAYISCFSTSSISLVTSGSEQVIDFTSIWAENGISLVDNNKFTFAEPGVYKLEFLTTIENSTNNEQDSWFWVKLNGNNFPNSATKVTVRKRKTNGQHTHQLVSISILGVAQTAGDYVQLYWTGEDTALGMPYEVATGVHPATPSVTLNIIRVG